jgi:sugar lactone lactonase YvrE
LTVTVEWPEVSAEFIPSNTQLILVQVTRSSDGSDLGELRLTQAQPTGTLSGILAGTDCQVTATAFPDADGTGTPVAQATTQATVPSGSAANVPLALGTTITQIAITPASAAIDVFEKVAFSAQAMDGSSNTVLVPSGFNWSTDNAAIASVSSSGDVTGSAEGTATITATEPESGVSGSTTVTVGVASVSLSRIGRIGEPGYAHIDSVSEIAASSDDEVFLLNSRSDTVNIYNLTGTPQDRVAIPYGSYTDIEIGPDGLIYVLNTSGEHPAYGVDRDSNVVNVIKETADPDSQAGGVSGMVFDASDRLHVLDNFDGQVIVFDLQGNFVTTYAQSGFGLGEFRFPIDMALGPSDRLFVGEDLNDRIQRFTETGVAELEWTSFPSFRDVAANSTRVFVADGDDPSLESFDVNGNLQRGSYGSFNDYRYLATTGTDRLVALTSNDRIRVLTASTSTTLTEWGTPVGDPGHFERARDIAMDAQGRVYVVDRGKDVVSRYSASGALETEELIPDVFPNYGPEALALHPSGDVYVGQRSGVGVIRYSEDLELIDEWAASDQGGTLSGLDDLEVGPDGNLYVIDGPAEVIRVFTVDGAPVKTFGTPGTGVGQLADPIALAFDAAGNLYVLDEVGKVLKYGPDDVFIKEWGAVGDGPGEFESPRGIGVDLRGLVYVADYQNRRIQVFSSEGDFVSEAALEDEFCALLANDVAIHPNGTTLVAAAPEDVLYYTLTN